MSTPARQFEQSEARQFTQSAARQRDGLGITKSDYPLTGMTVIGIARRGGYLGFVSALAHGKLYQKIESRITGVKIVTVLDGMGNFVRYDYEPHTLTEIGLIHAKIGDPYSYEQLYDSTKTSWHYVPDDAGPEDIGDAPVPDGWQIDYPTTGTIVTEEGGPGLVAVSETHRVWQIHRLPDPEIPGDLDFRYRVEITLSDPVDFPGLADAVAIMNTLNFECDQTYDILNYPGVQYHTGIGATPFATAVTRLWLRGPGGVALRNTLPYPGGVIGEHLFCGSVPQWDNGFREDPYPVDIAPLVSNIGYVRLLYYAAKSKVAAGEPEIMIRKFDLAGMTFEFASVPSDAGWETRWMQEPFGGAHLQFSTMPAVPTCEPCSQLAPSQRCYFERVFLPTETFAPGDLAASLTPRVQFGGNVWNDLDDDGVFDDEYTQKFGVPLPFPIRTGMGLVVVGIESSNIVTGAPKSYSTSTVNDNNGSFSYTLPRNVFGPVTITVDTQQQPLQQQIVQNRTVPADTITFPVAVDPTTPNPQTLTYSPVWPNQFHTDPNPVFAFGFSDRDG